MMKHWDEIADRIYCGFSILADMDRGRTPAAQMELVQGYLQQWDIDRAKYPEPERAERDAMLRAELVEEIEWLKQGNMNFPSFVKPLPGSVEYYMPTEPERDDKCQT